MVETENMNQVTYQCCHGITVLYQIEQTLGNKYISNNIYISCSILTTFINMFKL